MAKHEMKAVVCSHYGPPDVLKTVTVPRPVPKKGEILVRVRAAAVTVADARIRAARFPTGFGVIAKLMFGVSGPRNPVLGSCFSGEVVAVGLGVTEFAVGDKVFGMKGFEMGAYAEYIVIDQKKAVVKKPKTLKHPQAAALVFGGTTALYFLRDQAHLSAGQHILINGASGSVGSSAVQIAKAWGATVTAVCGPTNIKLMKSLGADYVLDYTKDNILDHSSHYDTVMDTVGNLSLQDCEQILKPGGISLLVMADLPKMLQAGVYGYRSPKKIQAMTGTATEAKTDIALLGELFIQKKLDPVVSKISPLEEVVAAHRVVDTGHKVGNIVLEM